MPTLRLATQEEHLTMDAALEDFLLAKRAANLSPATLDFYALTVSTFTSWLTAQGTTEPEDITAALVRRYAVSLQEREWKPSTLHAYCRGLRVFVNFLAAEGWNTQKVKVPMPRMGTPDRPILSGETLRDALQAARCTRERAVLLLLADTGLRKAEAAGIRVDDYDPRTGSIRVLGKGGKVRVVYTGLRTRRALLRLKPRGGLLLGLTPSGIRQVLRRVGERCGAHITPHMLRRFAATSLLRNGANLLTIQRILGHSSLATTSLYLRLDQADIQQAFEQASPVDRLKGA